MAWVETSTVPARYEDALETRLREEAVNLTPEVRARLAEMTPEERAEYQEQLGVRVAEEAPSLTLSPILPHDYFSESAQGAETFLGRDGRFQQGMPAILRGGVKGAMVAAAVLGGVGLSSFASDAYAAEPLIVPVVGKGAGFNDSQWRSELVVLNPSLTEAASGRIVFYDTNPGDDATNPSIPFTLAPRTNLVYEDILGAAGLSGNRALKILTEEAPVEVTARTWNEQDVNSENPEKTHLSQYTRAWKASELLEKGDLAFFVLPDSAEQADGRPAFRFNLHYYAERDASGEPYLKVELFNRNGEFIKGKFVSLPSHARGQFADFVPTLMEITQMPYDSVRILMLRGRLAVIGTPVQNNSDVRGLDDGGVQEPGIQRLVEEAVYTVAPTTVEANDPVVRHLRVTSRTGTRVDGCTFRGGWETSLNGDGTNVYEHNVTTYPTNPGTYDVYAICGISSLDGVFLGARTIPAGRLTVEAERNGYVAAYADAKAYIMGNLDQVSKWLSQGTVGGYATTQANWRGWLTEWFDGIASPTNKEISHLEFLDIGTSMNGNIVGFKFTDGIATSSYGLPEREFDTLRHETKAELPK